MVGWGNSRFFAQDNEYRLKGKNVEELRKLVQQSLPPVRVFYFPEDYIYAVPVVLMASEINTWKTYAFYWRRSSCIRSQWKSNNFLLSENGMYGINGLIFVEARIVKKLVMARGGQRVKNHWCRTRKDMENLFDASLFRIVVKVKSTQHGLMMTCLRVLVMVSRLLNSFKTMEVR